MPGALLSAGRRHDDWEKSVRQSHARDDGYYGPARAGPWPAGPTRKYDLRLVLIPGPQ